MKIKNVTNNSVLKYIREPRAHIHKEAITHMITAALFATTKTGNKANIFHEGSGYI